MKLNSIVCFQAIFFDSSIFRFIEIYPLYSLRLKCKKNNKLGIRGRTSFQDRIESIIILEFAILCRRHINQVRFAFLSFS